MELAYIGRRGVQAGAGGREAGAAFLRSEKDSDVSRAQVPDLGATIIAWKQPETIT